jgi:hypothetical protein
VGGGGGQLQTATASQPEDELVMHDDMGLSIPPVISDNSFSLSEVNSSALPTFAFRKASFLKSISIYGYW